jgi:Ala-tRNA(Pro) deacylase
MSLQSFLDDNQIHYRITRHDPAYTAQELAAIEHVSGKRVVKPVIIRADGQFYMCALPACYRVDLGELKQQLLADEVEVVDERHLRERFGDCDLGAAPPIGSGGRTPSSRTVWRLRSGGGPANRKLCKAWRANIR